MAELPLAASTTSEAAVTPSEADQETFTHIKTYIDTRSAASPIYSFLNLRTDLGLRLTHVSRGLVIACLPVTATHLNSGGSLHGSVSATIVDWAGGLAIAAWDRRETTGVSVDINVSYLSSAKLGDEIQIEGRVEKVGGSLAFTQVGIWKIDGQGGRGEPVAVGRHTKYVRGRK